MSPIQTWNKLAAAALVLTFPLLAGGAAKKTWTFDDLRLVSVYPN
jgi:hypothetical protein